MTDFTLKVATRSCQLLGYLELELRFLAGVNVSLKHITEASSGIFDYMAVGVPVMVSDLPDRTETFVRPGRAFAADREDVESLKPAIRSLVDALETAVSIGLRNHEKTLSVWNYENYEKQFTSMLEALLE